MTEPSEPAAPAVAERRHWLWAAAATAAAAGAGLAGWRLQTQEALPEAVQTLWAQQFQTPAGETLPLAVFKGKPLLLNFWATWCPPCVEELPMIEAFWREHAAKGLQVLGLAIDQPSAVRRFLAQQTLSFPMALAGLGGTELAKSLGNASGALPFSVFLAADGHVLAKKLGQLSKDDLKSWFSAAR
jgi:thiol-disulfide isomerase/thioredoxin